MSEHLESSDSLSMDQNIQVHANHQGENQIYIPYWEEEGSSSTHLNHLMEEVRILKNKCLHLENHLEQNHREFSSLNQLYIVAQTNERKLLKENQELRKRYRQANNQLIQIKIQLENAVTEINLSSKRDLEWREAHNKIKARQAELENQLKISAQENDSLRKRIGILTSQSQEGRQTEEQLRQIDVKWKAKYEDVEVQKGLLEKSLNKCKAELKETKDNLLHLKEEFDQNRLKFEKEKDESREQLSKGRSTVSSLERQLKDLRGVLQEVSAKNDEYECQNNDLRAKLSEETSKSRRLAKTCKEVEARQNELNERLQQKQAQFQQLQKSNNNLKARFSVQEKQINELQNALEVAQRSLEFLENVKAKLRQDIQKQKNLNETQIQKILSANEQRTTHLKKAHEHQKQTLLTRLSELQNQLTSINQRAQPLQGKNTVLEIDRKETDQLKSALRAAQARIQELENSSPLQCGHLTLIKKDKEVIKALTIEKERLDATLEDQISLIQTLKREILSLTEKSKKSAQIIKTLQAQNMRLEQAVGEIQSQKDSLEIHLRMINQQQERAKANQKDSNWLSLEAEKCALQLKVRKQNEAIALLEEKIAVLEESEIKRGERNQKQQHQALIIQTAERISLLQQRLARQQADRAGQASQFERALELKSAEIAEKTAINQRLSTEIKAWEQKYKQLSSDLSNQRTKVNNLQKELSQAREAPPYFSSNKNEAYYQRIIEQLTQKLKQQQNVDKRDEELDGVEQLEAEYQKQLQALKRLIDYKGSKQDQRKIEEVRKDYEARMQQMLREYERMQAEMIVMKRSVLEEYDASTNELGLGLQIQRWRVTVDELLAEKGILVERVSMWESRYEQLRCLFEAKLESKEETINLLMLKISNLQMSDRSCRCVL